ncbi:hypothetical protein GCM10023115_53360 [Pontixanthobacter gangjinensis]|uniref:Peptidase M56 domain-containing protein n=1 Tax=Christiangramia aestuarii TaxID=1028746 RepID=A0A7K1LQ83_9FLAO|nr:M56 family metallopeptidase [Christiangramia aestuarii]MUP42918.1 hypothetical protein [Christiangramia aestuarii]
MLIYLLKSGLCLLILFGFYKLCLENENFHKIKRVYLLGALILAFSLPLITLTYQVEVEPVPDPSGFEEVNFTGSKLENKSEVWDNLYIIAISIYLLGFLFFGYRFFKNLRSLLTQAWKNEKIRELNYIFILLGQKLVPFSFLNYIFLNRTEFKKDEISQAVIEHEKAHVNQKHSLDLLFIEILQVIFWFNPLFYWIKRSIKLNHEFLADSEVLAKDFNALEYSNILFNYSSGYHHNALASPLNHSLIKKRIIMITKDFSIKKLLLRAGLFLPVLGGCIFLFNNEIVAKPVYVSDYSVKQGGNIEIPFEAKTGFLTSDNVPETMAVVQDLELKIKVDGEKVWVNGQETDLENFSKKIDQVTGELSKAELKELNLSMKLIDTREEFMKNLDREFSKTRLASVSGRSVLPPPPPMPPDPGAAPPPPEPGNEIISVPPPPKPGNEIVEIDKERNIKKQEAHLREREERLKARKNELETSQKLSETEKKRRLQELEDEEKRLLARQTALEQRHAHLIEREAIEVERRAREVEREARIRERNHQELPAPPPPPKVHYPENATYYLNDNQISRQKALELIKEGKTTQVNIQQSSYGKDVVRIYN